MSAWVRLSDQMPPREVRHIMVRKRGLHGLPVVAQPVSDLDGYRTAFPAFTCVERGYQGVYRDAEELRIAGWEWCPIPE